MCIEKLLHDISSLGEKVIHSRTFWMKKREIDASVKNIEI